MAESHFHSFSLLPKKLRDQIWALAILPKRPSAHVFTLVSGDTKLADEVIERFGIDAAREKDRWFSQLPNVHFCLTIRCLRSIS
jgi:hypothetical protein